MKYGILLKPEAVNSEYILDIEWALEHEKDVWWVVNRARVEMVARPMNPDGTIRENAPVALLITGGWRQYRRDKKMYGGYATVMRGWPKRLVEVDMASMKENVGYETDRNDSNILVGA